MSAEIGFILPGGENILDFLQLRQVLSSFDRDLRDPLSINKKNKTTITSVRKNH